MSEKPPSLAEFNVQVAGLVESLGAAAFCAPAGQTPEYSLFVEEGRVIAEPKSSPRHPYGVYCEISDGLSAAGMSERVKEWVKNGEAYDEFLGMIVCRYNC